VRREDGPLLAGNVLGAAVLVADGVLDLFRPAGPEVSTGVPSQEVAAGKQPTFMLTTMPSPFSPLTVAVTTTSVSLATKLRMQRSRVEPL